MSRETLRFPLRPRTGLPQNAAWTTGLRSTYGSLHCSEPGHRKIQQRTHVTRSTHGLLHCSEPGCRKTYLGLPGCVAPTVSSAVPNRATAKLSSALMLRVAPTVSSIVPNRATAKLSSALMLRVAPTVSFIVPNRATGDICIGSCVNSPLNSLFFDER